MLGLSSSNRKLIAFTVVAALCLITCAGLLIFGQTEYPSGFDIQKFQKLNQGDSFETVIQELGYPWTYTVPGASTNLPLHSTNMTELRGYCSTNYYCVILEYSRPKFGDCCFSAIEVLIRSNYVYELRRYYFLDD
jgi:hypothetical protein